MNEIVNKFLLTGDKLIPEIHLKQPGFTYIAYRPFTKNKERIKKIKEIGDSRYIYRNELDKACFEHGAVNNEIKQNEQLTEELDKPIIKKFYKRKVYSSFKDNIWASNLADMQLISKYNKGTRFLLCAIHIFNKYAWVVPLKNKKGITIFNAFSKILDNFTRKPNKIWLDKSSECYNSSFKKWLKDIDIEMHSIHYEGKSAVAERFIRTLKDKICKHMSAVSENMYIDTLDDIINDCNNTCHKTIKMKPVEVKDNAYINSIK